MASTQILFLLFGIYSLSLISADDIDRAARKGVVFKLLREMANQTKADTLNLPANATSIRENITDTFSCENRTYGYYADVDNDCQVFHVCLTSQGARGRNVTYRWSFICPNETVFNQEVLTCTRPGDAINCEDSPMFYHLNMDIGKVPNDNETQANTGDTTSAIKKKDQRRRPIKRQNLIVENLMKEVKKDDLVADLDEELMPVVEEDVEIIEEEKQNEQLDQTEENFNIELPKKNTNLNNPTNNNEIIKEHKATTDIMKNADEEMKKKQTIHEVNGEYKMVGKRMDNARLASERSLKRRGKKINRGSFRYKGSY